MMDDKRLLDQLASTGEPSCAKPAADDLELDQLQESDWLVDDNPEARIDIRRLARKLQGQSIRYLLQVRCATPLDRESKDPDETFLSILATPIDVLGGEVEHHWATSCEYDLILVVRLKSHQISFTTIEMALLAMPEVRALRTTRLYPLDQPRADASLNWEQLLGEAFVTESDSVIGDRETEHMWPLPVSESIDPED